MNNPIRIITHSGTFHLDELLAIAALRIFHRGTPCTIIRTRDEEVIQTGDYVVDVGDVYDPAMNRFDHHQKGGAGARANGIPYSAFGLVWKEYGERISGSARVAQAIDEKIGHPVDMGDNIQEYYKLIRHDTEPLILQMFVAAFRPSWNDGVTYDERFTEILDMIERFLFLSINLEKDRVEGEALVAEVYNRTLDKRIVVLDGPYPWHWKLAEHPEPLYVVKPKNQSVWWEVECVRDNPNSFDNRRDLPLKWAGLSDGKLAEVTGVPDALFCHNHRYIAVARSKEGALRLAEMALGD